MGLETGSTISSFIASNPTSSDPINQGDNHVRLIKAVLQSQFPGTSGLGFNTAITATEAELNSLHTGNITTILPAVSGYVIGANSPILVTDTLLGALGKAQGQIDARSAITGNEIVTDVQSVNGLKVSSGVIDTVGYLTLSQPYTIQTLGTTSNAQWNTIAGTASQTYLVGSTFTCANIGTALGNGTAFRITNTTAQLVTSGAFIVTATYIIQSIGTTDFTLIGAASNTIGLSFVATGVGAGTGKAYRVNSLGLSGSVVLPVAPTIISPTISGAVMSTMASSVLTSGTAQSASGATISFTGIPSWAKRITVLLVGVTTVGSGIPAIRAGVGSYENTGYLGATVKVGSANTTDGGASATTSWDIVNSASSAYIYTGQLVITKVSGNQYIISGLLQYSTATGLIVNGVKTFSGPITQLQLQMQTGTDTFNGGSINIMYE